MDCTQNEHICIADIALNRNDIGNAYMIKLSAIVIMGVELNG